MKNKYTLMELIFAMGLLAMVAALFSSSAHNLRVMDRNFTRESRALQVLDNSLERISFEKKADFARIKDIFEDEFRRSVLEGDDDVRKCCEIRNGRAVLEIQRKNGKKIGRIEIKTGQTPAEEIK
ncbi:MAG TPA: hypothetical protein DCZ94_16920 [Lentisphaeria bacterium]|nr:MAG: hypothetical protein A2X48_08660 [Lentisphaerae bacterium GWF2_49_21]HBC88632.1 hypothetical protein [Lentisphaeria bacterium]